MQTFIAAPLALCLPGSWQDRERIVATTTTPLLRVTLLECLAIRDGAERRLGGRHLPVLLSILASERPRAVGTEELAEALWGEDLPESWQASLRMAVSKVRAFLVEAGFEPAALRSVGGGYLLKLDLGVVLDIESAAEQMHAAEQALVAGQGADAADRAAQARTLLEPPFLPGSAGPWVESKRHQLKALLVRALELEAEAFGASGRLDRAVAAARRAIELDPYHEGAHRALIRAHARGGNKAEALGSYERCRRLLSEELGVDPAPATEGVYLQVLRDEIPSMVEAVGMIHRAGPSAPARPDLVPEELERLGDEALWAGDHSGSISARRRAHRAYLEAGDRRAAARVALALSSNHGIRSQVAEAEGWFRTAARLLATEPDSPEHGQLAAVGAIVHLELGDLAACMEQAQRALELGERLGIPDLQALGLTFQGLSLARMEQPAKALPMLDEAMTLALAGGVTPFAAGAIFCRTIRTSLDLFDYRRAGEWIGSVRKSAEQTGFGGYQGDCSAHLAAALHARGSWTEAEREAERACETCDDFEVSHVGLASYTLGEIRLRRGDLSGADRAFRRASEHGVMPQPGLALLQLARGDAAGALASAKAWLDGTSVPLVRARVLPAAVEIALAVGDLTWSGAAADELAAIADTYASAALQGAAGRARASVKLSQGDPAGAVRELHSAAASFRQAETPYEVARTRRLLAEALLADGDGMGAKLELEAAERLFERLGASRETRAVQIRLSELRPSLSRLDN